jgi:CBS domain-containing protein
MNRNPPLLHVGDTVADALRSMLSHRVLALPVVDDDRHYLGMFAKSRLFGLVVPMVLTFQDVAPDLGAHSDFGFLSDDLDDLRQRLRGLADRPVAEFADATVPLLRPDSPLMAVIVLLYRTRNFLPVVDQTTGRLEGVVSTWETLTKLAEGIA